MTYPLDEEESITEEELLEMDVEMLRDDLVGELHAINQYQGHIDIVNDEEARLVLQHIRDDEKEHVAELVKIIQKLDPTQAEISGELGRLGVEVKIPRKKVKNTKKLDKILKEDSKK